MGEPPGSNEGPSFTGFLKASGQADVSAGTDKKEFDQSKWSANTARGRYSSDTLIANWNEERFDVSKLAKPKRLPSDYDHYFETTYRHDYLKSPPSIPEALKYTQGEFGKE